MGVEIMGQGRGARAGFAGIGAGRHTVGWALLPALILSVAAAPAWAVEEATPLGLLRYETWTTEDGLPQNSVNSVVQDGGGYIWAGTFEGLVRFDGLRFKVFDEEVVPHLHRSIMTIMVDGDGALWIGTNGGGVLRMGRDGARRWTTAEGLQSDTVQALVQDAAGRVWVGTDRGLDRIEGDEVRQFTSRRDGAPDTGILALALIGDTLYIGTSDAGLVRFAQGTFTFMDHRKGLRHDMVTALVGDGRGGVWIGTYGGALHHLDPGAARIEPVDVPLSSKLVRTLYRDRSGALWIGAYGGGLDRLVGDRVDTFQVGDGLTNAYVRSIVEDREGSIWFGTNGGLNRLAEGTFRTYTVRQGLPGDFTRVVAQDRRGRVWVGIDGGGVAVQRGDRFVALDDEWLGEQSSVRALWPDRQGGMWIGVYGVGLLHVSAAGEKERWGPGEGLSNTLVRALYEDDQGRLWIGTKGGGLFSLAPGGELRSFTTRDGLTSNKVHALLMSRSGVLWIGTVGGGLARYWNGAFTTLRSADGLASDHVFGLYEDEKGVIWAATQGGLTRIDGRRIVSYGRREGMPATTLFQILEDQGGHFWISSNRGVYRVARADLDALAEGRRDRLRVERLGRAEGMRSSQCNGASQPAGWKTSDGQVWFPTAKGVVAADPERLRRNTEPPPVLIEEVWADDELVPRRDGRYVVPPGRLRIDVRYTGLSLLVPQRVRFRTRLDGVDPDWVDMGGERHALYMNLRPGTYTFRVEAMNNDGVWSERAARATILIEGRWWDDRRLLGALLLAALASCWGLHRWSLARLRRRLAREAEG